MRETHRRLLVAVLFLLLAGCSHSSTAGIGKPRRSPSATAQSGATPSPASTPTPSPSDLTATVTSTGLVQRSAASAFFTIQVPPSWVTTTACGGAGANLCNYISTNTAQDVWYNPADTGQRVTVFTCGGSNCAAVTGGGGQVFPAQVAGAVTTQTVGATEVGFRLGAGTHPQGPYAISGVIVASQSQTTSEFSPDSTTSGPPEFPLYTVMPSLPDSKASLSNEILDNFELQVESSD